MSDYHRILTRLVNAPLAISQEKLEILTSKVSLRLLAGQSLDSGFAPPQHSDVPVKKERLGIVKVFDSLVAKNGGGSSGATSYEYVSSRIKSYLEDGVTKLLFYIDSPGGEVAGLFGLTSYIASLPATYGVETIAFTDGYMTSAAYGIGSACQTIYATENANIGSIGVIMSLVDMTEMDKAKGISYTILRSKEDKALFNPHEKISEAVLTKCKKTLAELDSIFNANVNGNRPSLSIESIVNMKGDAFLANKALELGLIDGLVSSIDELIQSETNGTQKRGKRTMATSLEELQSELASLKQENTSLKAGIESAKKEGITQERTRCLGIINAGIELKVSQEAILKQLAKDRDVEEARDMFVDIASAIGSHTNIDTSGIGLTPSVSTVNHPNVSTDVSPFAFLDYIGSEQRAQ